MSPEIFSNKPPPSEWEEIYLGTPPCKRRRQDMTCIYNNTVKRKAASKKPDSLQGTSSSPFVEKLIANFENLQDKACEKVESVEFLDKDVLEKILADGGTSFYATGLKILRLEEDRWPESLKGKWRKEIRYICHQLLTPGSWKLIHHEVIQTFSLCPKAFSEFLLPYLKLGIDHSDWQVRIQTLYACFFLPFENQKIFDEFIRKGLTDVKPNIRRVALIGLTKVSTLPFLNGLNSNDPSVKVKTAIATYLRQRGIDCLNESIPKLTCLLFDPHPALSEEAFKGLYHLREKMTKEDIRALKDHFKNAGSKKQLLILQLIGSLSKEKEWLTHVLTHNFENQKVVNAFTHFDTHFSTWLTILMDKFKQDALLRKELIAPLIIFGQRHPDETLAKIEEMLNPPVPHELMDIVLGINKNAAQSIEARIDKILAKLDSIARAYLHGENREETRKGLLMLVGYQHLDPIYKPLAKALQNERLEIRLAALKTLEKVGSTNPQKAIDLISPIIKGYKSETELLEGLKCIESLGNPVEINPLVDFLIDLLAKNNISKQVRNAIYMTLGSTGTRVGKILKMLLPLFLKGKVEEWENTVYHEVLMRLAENHLTPEERKDFTSHLASKLIDGSPHDKRQAIDIIAKIKWEGDEPLDLLKMMVLENPDNEQIQKNAIHALHKINAPLEKWIRLLKKFLNKSETHFVLSHYNLSPYPEVIIQILENCDFFKLSQDPLSNTPLKDLLLNYNSGNKLYLKAIAHKCLAENIELFAVNNDLCFFNKDQVHRIPNAYKKIPLIQKAVRNYQQLLIGYRAVQLEQSEYYATAGNYYKQLRSFPKMLACFQKGDAKMDPEAVFWLGRSFQSGLGITKKENRLENAVSCYMKGAAQGHPPSIFCYGIALQYGLGVKQNVDAAQQIFNTFQHSLAMTHIFNSSPYAYLKGRIPPAGTIGLALATLDPTAYNREQVLDYIEKKQRFDHFIAVPYVHLKGRDLIISIPTELAKNQQLLEKWSAMGLNIENIPEKKIPPSQRTYVMEAIVEDFRISYFLEVQLGLSEKVYYELMHLNTLFGTKKC